MPGGTELKGGKELPFPSAMDQTPKPVPTLTFEFVPELRLIISCTGARPVGDSEWNLYLNVLGSHLDGSSELKALVISDGAVPSQAQRTRLFAATKQHSPLVAVVTESTAVHFVLSVMALVHRDLRSFIPGQIGAALKYLGIPQQEHERVRGIVARLRVDLENPDCYAA